MVLWIQDRVRDGSNAADSGMDTRNGVGGAEEPLGEIFGAGIASIEGGRGLRDNALRDGVCEVVEAEADGREE